MDERWNITTKQDWEMFDNNLPFHRQTIPIFHTPNLPVVYVSKLERPNLSNDYLNVSFTFFFVDANVVLFCTFFYYIKIHQLYALSLYF